MKPKIQSLKKKSLLHPLKCGLLLVAAFFVLTPINAQHRNGGGGTVNRGQGGVNRGGGSFNGGQINHGSQMRGGIQRPGGGQARPQMNPSGRPGVPSPACNPQIGNSPASMHAGPGNNIRPGSGRPSSGIRGGIGRGGNQSGITRPAYNRPGTYRRPVYTSANPAWRYNNIPRRNTVIAVIPSSYRNINYAGFNYRYHNGSYYRPFNNGFIVCAPPIGIFIDIMPLGYRRIYVGEQPYYYYNGGYYNYHDNNYYVVSPPVGAVVESIPAGYETLTIDGETYYTVDGAQYKPVTQHNGEIWYEVVKAN